jgi:hypothetical protein
MQSNTVSRCFISFSSPRDEKQLYSDIWRIAASSLSLHQYYIIISFQRCVCLTWPVEILLREFGYYHGTTERDHEKQKNKSNIK